MNKIQFLKLLDMTIGKPIIRLFRRSCGKVYEKFTRVLIIRPGGIGDAVLLLPAINSLSQFFPKAEIDILCEKRNAGIFELSRAIRRIYLYDRNWELVHCIRNTYDVVVDTEQWHRLSAVVAHLTGAGIRIGFDTNERRKLFTHKISYSHDDYEVNSFIHLVEPLTGINPDFNSDAPFIDISDDSSYDLLAPFSKENKIIAIFAGASVKKKRWGADRFGAVAKVLRNKGYRILILGASVDKRDADKIKVYVPDCIDLTGKTTICAAAAVLKVCRLLISADSGLLHIAYAVGTPTVSLFGSSNENKWAPKGRRHCVINKHLRCSPCSKFGYTPPCKIQVKCLSSITVDEVIKAAETVLHDSAHLNHNS